MTSTVVIAALALRLPGATAQRESDYRFVSTLGEIHRFVEANYVEPVDDAKLKEGAINGMLSTLDPYTVWFPPSQDEAFRQAFEGQLSGIGVNLRELAPGKFEIASPIDGSPAAAAGIQAGDRILKVDGKDVSGLEFEKLSPLIKGPDGTRVTLTLERAGKTLDVVVTRASVQLPTVTGYERNADQSWNYFPIPGERIAYVRVSQFTGETADAFAATLRKILASKTEGGQTTDLKGLIVDLRENGGGLVNAATSMADLFLPNGTPILTTRDRTGSAQLTVARGAEKLPNFPLVLLVNGDSASASEIFAGALSDNRRATLVGTRTFGKGSVQEIHDLPNHGGTLKVTIAHYFLPSGRMIHRKPDSTVWGVDPQILVPVDEATERSIWSGRLARENWRRPGTKGPATQATDPQLDAALQTLLAIEVMSGGGRG